MNASDIVKAKQNRTLFQAYYHPMITPSTTTTTIVVSTFISSISDGRDPPPMQSNVCSTVIYNNLCMPSFISYQLANDVNQGKYLCNTYTLAQQVGGNAINTTSTAQTQCKISNLQWQTTPSSVTTAYNTVGGITYSTISATSLQSPVSTFILPVICPLVEFYQGTNFASKCSVCPQNGPCTC
jgi:hypothetical protein